MATRAGPAKASGSRTATVDMSCWRRSPSVSSAAVPRPRGAARSPTARMNDTRVPPLGRAARRGGAWVPRGGRDADQRLPPPGPRGRGRRHLLDGGGHQRSVGGPVRGAASSRRIWSPRWFVPTAMCRAIHPGGTGWGSGLARTGVVELQVRRRRVLPDRARSARPSHPHGAVVHERRAWPVIELLDELILPGLDDRPYSCLDGGRACAGSGEHRPGWFWEWGLSVVVVLVVAILITIVIQVLVRRFRRKLEGSPSFTQELNLSGSPR